MPTGISSLLDGNTFFNSEKNEGNLVNAYFSILCTEENMSNLPLAIAAAHSNWRTLSDVVITPQALEKKVNVKLQ